jgi:hypothetical protein
VDPDPGFGAFLTPGSEIQDGSQTYISESYVTNFGVKYYNTLSIGSHFSVLVKKNIIFNL